MKVFISSPIRGLERFRDAAGRAAGALRYEVKRSADSCGSATTPQQACLAGVRWDDAVVLVLGGRYGILEDPLVTEVTCANAPTSPRGTVPAARPFMGRGRLSRWC
jgi:hypothetical protein